MLRSSLTPLLFYNVWIHPKMTMHQVEGLELVIKIHYCCLTTPQIYCIHLYKRSIQSVNLHYCYFGQIHSNYNVRISHKEIHSRTLFHFVFYYGKEEVKRNANFPFHFIQRFNFVYLLQYFSIAIHLLFSWQKSVFDNQQELAIILCLLKCKSLFINSITYLNLFKHIHCIQCLLYDIPDFLTFHSSVSNFCKQLYTVLIFSWKCELVSLFIQPS